MKFRKSVFSRHTSILKIAGRVVVSEIKQRVLELNSVQEIQEKINLAKMLTGELSNLKGAAMKLGQMLSLDASDILPPEVVEIFSKLQKDAAPIDFEIIDTQIKDALRDKYPKAKIDKSPLAVASIGQVHQGVYEGINLVFKIQYPEIEKTIESDVKLLKLLFSQANFLLGKSLKLEALFNELRTTLLLETDYLREGQMMKKAKDFFDHDKRYLFPSWYSEISTGVVLTMDYMPGVSISEWIKSNPDQIKKDKIGRALCELYLEEFFNLGMVQTDPNPGNFLINSHEQIVILDFGASKEYDMDFREDYKKILRATYEQDIRKVLEYSIKFNLINSKEDVNVQNDYYEMLNCMIEPFRVNGNFDFTDQAYFQRSKDSAINLTKKLHYSSPPEKILFLHRKLGGIFQLLKKMEVKLNLNDYWKKYISTEG